MLDERFRQRLRELSALDKEPLPRGARDRIVFNVTARGPALIRGARRERVAFIGGGVVLAAAAAAALFVRVAGSGDGQIGVVTEGRGAAASPAAPLCESRQAPAASFVDQQQRRLLDLGALGVASAKPGSDVVVKESSACRTVIALKAGRLSVRARDLGGGELIVQTRNAEVVAQGTLFAVTQDEGGVTVEVAEGRVQVRRLDQNQRVVEAGSRLTLGADLVTESRLSAQAVEELRSATQK
jgi:ferric-dicitrate binding protein FerR (iron transport regulator)